MKPIRSVLVLLAVVAVMVVGLAAFGAGAADHLEAPLVRQDGRTDINDVYAFVNGSNTVLVMTVNPAAGVISPTTLRGVPGHLYEFLVDNDGDYEEDIILRLRANKPNKSGRQYVNFYMVDAHTGRQSRIGKGFSDGVRPLTTGGNLFVGLRDDPFFFDLAAFQDVVKGAGGGNNFCGGGGDPDGAVDFFAGLNASAIVVEIPSSKLTNGSDTINVWGRTTVKGQTRDRMGKPAIATALINDGNEDAFNATVPADDPATWGAEVKSIILALSSLDGSGYDSATADVITGLLLPDVLTLNTTSTAGYDDGPLNGRRLDDDVIDFSLFVVTGGLAGSAVVGSDCINGNDKAFSSSFPYLADPH